MELNARDGFARYLLHEPQKLDFEAIEEAADDAGYTLTKLTLVVRGRALAAAGAGQRMLLQVAKSEQQIQLDGSAPTDADIRIKGTVSGWKDGDALLTVLETTLE